MVDKIKLIKYIVTGRSVIFRYHFNEGDIIYIDENFNNIVEYYVFNGELQLLCSISPRHKDMLFKNKVIREADEG